ncbi:MAG: glycosyltransferase [Bryobacteraceae bacterium]|nr:glycosyltransferase [Bryobacteraceae bacterium]
MTLALRLLRALPLLLLSPLLVAIPVLAFGIADLLFLLFGKRKARQDQLPHRASASVVIPNWNGRDLLEKYLPSVVTALAGHPDNEIVVVDNGSTDGSAQFLREHFPQVKLVALEKNLGFGGGSNAGFRAAKNDIVVLLNSDMRVDPGFLAPLLEGFHDPRVFAVSCQIFFSDPTKLREETGLTQGWWADGGLRVRHRLDESLTEPLPCFYGGGGSCAFHRQKFLELGAFDHLLRPFYLEDTDLGYQAWKRGWWVYYEPRSVVWHEHRGTIGKKFSPEYIQGVLKKNFILFVWKNITSWPKLLESFAYIWCGSALSAVFGHSPERATFSGLARAAWQLPGALASRWAAKTRSEISDDETFRRPLGGYFRDRFAELPAEVEKPGVLLVSPYPIEPPIHGGAVFMSQTIRELAPLTRLHVIALLDAPDEAIAHEPLREICGSVEHLVRLEGKPRKLGSVEPHAVREFSSQELEWLIHRQIYLQRIDVLQLEYTNLGQYAGEYQRLLNAVFEHDVYFQSIARGLRQPGGKFGKLPAAFEYLRALRFELNMLRQVDQAQVCTQANRDYLLSFAPELAGKLDAGLRAGIRCRSYDYMEDGREPDTLLFIGSFRHQPNQEALFWFLREVFWRILAERPQTKLVIVGSDPPDRHALPHVATGEDPIIIRGRVGDVREPLAQYAAFICPILAGSGVRVKLLESFAAGIPAVSTYIGAEGLATRDGEFCKLADDPAEFARHALHLLANPLLAREMTRRARAEVEANWDMPRITAKLASRYRDGLRRKRQA